MCLIQCCLSGEESFMEWPYTGVRSKHDPCAGLCDGAHCHWQCDGHCTRGCSCKGNGVMMVGGGRSGREWWHGRAATTLRGQHDRVGHQLRCSAQASWEILKRLAKCSSGAWQTVNPKTSRRNGTRRTPTLCLCRLIHSSKRHNSQQCEGCLLEVKPPEVDDRLGLALGVYYALSLNNNTSW